MSEQRVEGHDNVVVVVDGDHNRVTIRRGAASLTLDRAHRRRGGVAKTIRELLLTELRATTLVGRGDDLDRFGDWLTTPSPMAVHCVIGRGGAGKTRFGIELCERAEAKGWTAGFVADGELRRFHRENNLSGWQWPGPTLLVIDYAAAKAGILRDWLNDLARRPDPDASAHPLRILLLERHADRDIGWWSDLGRPGGLSGRRGDSLVEGVEPFALPSLTDREDRRRLMTQVMEQAAALTPSASARRPPEPGTDPEFDRALSAERIDHEPLHLMMAAIVAVEQGAPAALAKSRTELAETIAHHEAARLEKIAAGHGLDPLLFPHLAACVTLQGGCDRDAAEQLIAQERATNSAWSGVSPEDAAEWLADGLPGPNGGVDAIRPDLIGGAFLLIVLRRKKRSLDKQRAIIGRAWDRAGPTVAQTIIRAAVDHAGYDPKHDSLDWLHYVIARADLDDALAAIADAIPQQTVALRDCACAVLERLVAIRRQGAGDDLGRTGLLAVSLNNLANRLSELGRREAALEAATEAVAHYRGLVAQRPDAITPALAMSLNNLAIRLSDLGRREGALEAATQAVTLCRQLAAQRPDAIPPALAMSLNNLANRLSDLGRREEALEAGANAVGLYRALAAQRPDAFTSDLAMSLQNLAKFVSEVGRWEAALEAATEAAGLYRGLAAQRSDAFSPDFAMSLNTLGACLSGLGCRETALEAATEAAELYRGLAAQRPGAFTPTLAMSLNTLGTCLSGLGCREEALEAATESVALYRALAAQRPDVFIPDLARSLAVLANCRDGLGDGDAALEADREAIATLSVPFLQLPQAFAALMAAIAQQHIERCERLGRVPDMDLLTPIGEVFQNLQNESKEPEA